MTCSYTFTSTEGTSYCRLAESTGRRIDELLAEVEELRNVLMWAANMISEYSDSPALDCVIECIHTTLSTPKEPNHE